MAPSSSASALRAKYMSSSFCALLDSVKAHANSNVFYARRVAASQVSPPPSSAMCMSSSCCALLDPGFVQTSLTSGLKGAPQPPPRALGTCLLASAN